ncbi:uncharacterized protein RSE6_10541 [Rhynchosporium secalis]|uniref:Uncharacterized protein n=1 Tax=Rhynchosporium secalis TaxID=38038 RepID=A0A1E1MKR2_RHYSE|nr:uncharacterized protein RSE6_10541 [Rhynchosporium secalis]
MVRCWLSVGVGVSISFQRYYGTTEGGIDLLTVTPDRDTGVPFAAAAAAVSCRGLKGWAIPSAGRIGTVTFPQGLEIYNSITV